MLNTKIKSTNKIGTLNAPAALLREIGVGTYQGVKIVAKDGVITIIPTNCPVCGCNKSYATKLNTIRCEECKWEFTEEECK